jgi:pilus assembly protein CpaB
VVLSDSLADEMDAPPTRVRKPGQSQSGETSVPLSLLSRVPDDPQKEKPTAAMVSKADWKAMGAWNAPEMLTGVIPGGTLKHAREKGLTKHATPFMVAAALTVVALVVGWLTLRGSERAVQRGWTLSPVMVAAHDLPEGTLVTFDMISQRAVPEQFVTPSVVKPDGVNYVVNQKLVVPVQAGDPLMWTQFEASRATQRLSTRVSKRARAVAIPVSNPASVGNWVQPTDHVDVVATVPDKNSKAKKVAVTVLRDVIVLTTGKLTNTSNLSILSPHQRTYSHVSLMLVPEEAEILTLANEVADLSLTLRNEEDLEVDYEHHKTDIDTLLSGERTKLLQNKRFKTIQIIRATPKEVGGEPVKPKNN